MMVKLSIQETFPIMQIQGRLSLGVLSIAPTQTPVEAVQRKPSQHRSQVVVRFTNSSKPLTWATVRGIFFLTATI